MIAAIVIYESICNLLMSSNQASSIAFKRSVFLFSDVFNKGKTAKLIVSIAIEHNNEKEYNKKK